MRISHVYKNILMRRSEKRGKALSKHGELDLFIAVFKKFQCGEQRMSYEH